MSDGIRATVSFADPGTCPIAKASHSTDGPIEQVSTSVALPDNDGSVSEFMADSGLEAPWVEPVFSYGETTLYRITHEEPADCPCETLGEYDCPIHRYVAEDGTLTLVFHAPEFETLQAIMDSFREEYPPVDVQRLLQPPLEGSPEDRVFVNRGKLTDRQREVLKVAFEMGYFRRPKGANATEIADALGIAQSTFTEHLVAAQRKLLTDILE
ncbi:helix-turn-helix domain-containing protein [Halovenus salina]|uniref:Helix-turn-helix domain-containing protein n=1 Tax=Halovenus salina TaxID=1510225 RepID=A0ABD5VVK0_9EURY|nr:helix-turn-helix domain-containing protein [Halovenus salina]